MKKLVMGIVLALMLALPAPVLAGGGHFGGYRGWHGGGPGWHGGGQGWHGGSGWHGGWPGWRGGWRGGVYIGLPWWGPAYPYPYYPAPYVSPGYGYYCPRPRGYYPAIRFCAGPWVPMTPY